MNKNDLRVKRTLQMIEEAFFDLVVEKGYAKITVKDISDRAMINRNTFYLHYLDKDDLLEKIIIKNMSKQNKTINTLLNDYDFKNPSILQNVLYEILLLILNIFEEDIEFYRIVLLDVDTTGHFTKASSFFKNLILKDTVLTGDKRIAFDFIFGGAFECLCHWIKYDSEDKHAIAKQLSLILFDTIKYLK